MLGGQAADWATQLDDDPCLSLWPASDQILVRSTEAPEHAEITRLTVVQGPCLAV